MFLLTGIICAFALGSLVFVPDGAEDDEINSSDTDGAGHDDPLVQSQTNYELPPFATASSYILWGTNVDDLIDALDGNDQLNGYGGDDVLNGGEGADEIFGGSGKDTLHGDGGNDILKGDLDDDLLTGGDGDDDVYGGMGQDTLYGGYGADTLYGGLGSDQLWGGKDDDALIGGYGQDTLIGGLGGDSLFGGEGNDWIDGIDADDAADFLNGGAGQDILFAGKNDILTGGHGADTFVIRLGDATEDTLPEITDFRSGQDSIDIAFDIKGGIDENPKIEFEEQANGTIHVMINGLPLVQIKAGLEINEGDLNFIFQSSG